MRSQPRLRNAWLGGLLACACLAAAVTQAYRLEHLRTAGKDPSKELIYLPTPQQTRLMSLGYTGVMADYYWVKALQYFADVYQARNHYKNLADFLELVVALDPNFEFAYVFAGISIPYDSGRLKYVNTERSTSFLERGVQRFPRNWHLRMFLGYNYLNYHNRPKDAAEQFAAASRIPGAPEYVGPFAARLFSVSGDMDRATSFVEQALRDTNNPELRQMFERRLHDLEIERQLRELEGAAKQFQERNARLPRDLAELAASGLVQDVPAGYWLDSTGVAHAPEASERMIIYVHPEEAKLLNTP